MSRKIFENDLVTICKNKVTLTLNKPAYIRMCILCAYEDFSNDNEMFDFRNYWTKSKYYDNPNKLVVGETKDETADVAIEEFVGLKPEKYLYLVNNNSKYKKAKGVRWNVAVTISHNEYKDVLLNKKCLRHLMNSIQTKINNYLFNKRHIWQTGSLIKEEGSFLIY